MPIPTYPEVESELLTAETRVVYAAASGMRKGLAICARTRKFVAPAIVALLACGLLLFFVLQVQQADKTPEFVYYRIGDALLIKNGEARFVRPVQGLPNALLSKAIVSTLESPVSRDGLARYSLAFTAAVCALVLACIGWAWRQGARVGAIQAFALIAPWWLGTAAMGMLMAPEYWQTEWLYVSASVPLLYWLRGAKPLPAHLIAGAWLAVGVLTKVSLLPMGLVLLLYLPAKNVGRLCAAALGAAATFCMIDLLYIGSVGEAVKLIAFQLDFFAHPNRSHSYSGFTEAFFAFPSIPMLLAAVLLLCVMTRRSLLAVVFVMWCAGYLLLLVKRPHDTSITSFGISLGFMAAMLALENKRTYLALSIAVSGALVGASLDGFSRVREVYTDIAHYSEHAEQNRAADEFFRDCPAAWYVPRGDWNATYPPQGIAILGGLGIKGKFTPDSAFVAYHSVSPCHRVIVSKDELDEAVTYGQTVFWTRQVGTYSEGLPSNREERVMRYRGMDWIFGRSVDHVSGIEVELSRNVTY